MIELLQKDLATIKDLCERYGVSRLEVFGSAARGDFDLETSDLDFVIEFFDYGPGISKRYFGFVRAMEDHFLRKIDTVFGPTMKNPIFQEEVDRSRELLYESPGREIAA
ncbi:MAG: nucleotidyltransferase family protein [Thermomicrobiales bacterium]